MSNVKLFEKLSQKEVNVAQAKTRLKKGNLSFFRHSSERFLRLAVAVVVAAAVAGAVVKWVR